MATKPLCQCILGSGINKGKQCQNMAKIPHVNPRFCGTHKACKIAVSQSATTEQYVKQETERRAKQAEERRAKQAEERRAKQVEERRAKQAEEQEAERKMRQEAERKTRQEAERKMRQEAERKTRQEAERKTRQEAERKTRQEAERKTRQEAEKKTSDEFEPTDEYVKDGRTYLPIRGLENRQFSDFCDDYRRDKPLGQQGNYSTNYHSCKGQNCDFVEKVIELGENNDDDCLEPVINEMNITKKLSDLGIGAHVETMCIRDNYASIVKKYYKGTFTDLMLKHHPNLPQLVDEIEKLVKRMHDAGFVSRDIRPPNILYDETSNGIQLVLNHFGLAIRTKSKKIRQYDLNSVEEIRQGVKDILSGNEITVQDIELMGVMGMPIKITFVKSNGKDCSDWQ